MANKKPFYREFRRTLYETVSDSGNSVLRYRGHDDKEHYVASSEAPDVKPCGGMTETTWQELKDKRDAGELTPGSLYRITDYNCTTTQENTQSAGHQFDIVLLALSEDKLAEEGWAMMHDNIYDVTFSDGVTLKCWFYENPNSSDDYNVIKFDNTSEGILAAKEDFIINENYKTATTSNWGSTEFTTVTGNDALYNYFQNSNLSAWKVWYCLDNDTSRFAWADDSVDEDSPASIYIVGIPRDLISLVESGTYIRNASEDIAADNFFAWKAEEGNKIIYTTSETPTDNKIYADSRGTMVSGNIGTLDYTPAHEGTGLPNGRGVIYRLIDEWNNDCPYDFKNIQFVRKLTDGVLDTSTGTDTWVYTFSYVVDKVIQDGSLNLNTDNTISSIQVSNRYQLNNIVSIDNEYGHVYNSFINCQNVTIFDDVEYAQFINCNNFQMDDTTNGSIFIKKKKVLTES